MRTGLIAYDKSKTCPGYVLYTPMNGDTTILLNTNGNIEHTWKHNYRGNYGYLLPNSNIFMTGKTHDETWDLIPGWNDFKGGILQELDPQGNVLWEHRDPYQHHDGRKTKNGGAIYLSLEKLPENIASKVKGGLTDTENYGMYADTIIEINEEGDTLWTWSAAQHLNFETDTLPPNFTRYEWTHGNTIVPIGSDKVMVSFRSISVVAIINKNSGEFIWKIGPEILAQQHDPSILDNGNVLVFNNGTLKKNSSRAYSQVLEIDPRSNEVVWEYGESPYYNFYSPHISGARRLPNGNTLITEGAFGRMFQVTKECEVVWEYINPVYIQSLQGYYGNTVFRANHYNKNEIAFI
jgi:hypothetical protein